MNAALRIPAIVFLIALFLIFFTGTLMSLFLAGWLSASLMLIQVGLPQLQPENDTINALGWALSSYTVLTVSAIAIIPLAVAARFSWVGLEWVVEQYWLDSWDRWQEWKQHLLAKKS